MFFFLSIIISTSIWAADFFPTSFSAHFEESFTSATTGKVKKSFGELNYKYPGHLRLEKKSPDASTFVSNPTQSWYYIPPFVDGEEGQVTIQKTPKLVLIKVLDSLKGGVDNNKFFTSKAEKNNYVLTFSETIKKEFQINKLHLVGKSIISFPPRSLHQLEKLQLVYSDNRTVDLKFLDIKENPVLDKAVFEFKIPPKTKTIKE